MQASVTSGIREKGKTQSPTKSICCKESDGDDYLSQSGVSEKKNCNFQIILVAHTIAEVPMINYKCRHMVINKMQLTKRKIRSALLKYRRALNYRYQQYPMNGRDSALVYVRKLYATSLGVSLTTRNSPRP